MGLWIYAILFCSVLWFIDARLEEQIYLPLSDASQLCTRVLNGTHQFGCQSSSGGNTGVVVYVGSMDALKYIEANYDAKLNLIVAIDLELFNKDTMKFLKEERVRGVLLFNENGSSRADLALSEDSTCPNREFDLYGGTCRKQWNRAGTLISEGLRFTDWEKPIFLVKNATTIKVIRNECYEAFNANGSLSGSSLCSVKMGFRMAAAGNAQICLRRNDLNYLSEIPITYCSPLEDKNVIAIVPPPWIGVPRPKVFVIGARVDSFSTFTDSTPGEVSVITSLISTIAVAEAIGKNLSKFEEVANRTHRTVMFSFFHGESFGYIGSSRAIFEMMNGSFPVIPDANKPDVEMIKVEDIDAFIEVQMLLAKSNLFAHVDGTTYFTHNKTAIDALIAAANNKLSADGFGISLSLLSDLKKDFELPPSSFQTFLKQKRSIAGFVVAPFGSTYDYKKLNSFADEEVLQDRNSTVTQIMASATAVLGAMCAYIYKDESAISSFKIDEEFVSTLYDCFISSRDWQTCEFFKQIVAEDSEFVRDVTPDERKVKETSISTEGKVSLIRLIVKALMVYSLGSKDLVNVSTRDQCEDLNKHGQLYLHTWQKDPDSNTSICYRNAMYLPLAKSPAFEEKGYDFKSGKYSTWVESTWSFPELVLFLTPPYRAKFDLAVFVAGCLFLVLSCIVVEIIYLSKKDFFDPPTPPAEADKNAAPL